MSFMPLVCVSSWRIVIVGPSGCTPLDQRTGRERQLTECGVDPVRAEEPRLGCLQHERGGEHLADAGDVEPMIDGDRFAGVHAAQARRRGVFEPHRRHLHPDDGATHSVGLRQRGDERIDAVGQRSGRHQIRPRPARSSRNRVVSRAIALDIADSVG